MMLAARITSPHQGRVVETTTPTPRENEVLIEVHRAGICGTDLHIWHGDYDVASYPLIPGHEFSGVVTAVGSEVVTVRPGERVTADPNLPCHRCSNCQRNQQNQCLNLQAVGVTRNGAFARHLTVPESAVFPIGSLSYEQAALVEPLACVVWGLKRLQLQPGDTVLIFGAGPMGCLMMQAVRHAGASRVVMVDKAPRRLELASQLGASDTLLADELHSTVPPPLPPSGFDVVADATGIPRVIEQAFTCVRPRGKLWIFGVAPGNATATFSPYQIFRKDLTIIGSFALDRTFHQSIALIQDGAIRVEPLVSHRLPLEDFQEGMDLAEHDPERMKVQFVVSE